MALAKVNRLHNDDVIASPVFLDPHVRGHPLLVENDTYSRTFVERRSGHDCGPYQLPARGQAGIDIV